MLVLEPVDAVFLPGLLGMAAHSTDGNDATGTAGSQLSPGLNGKIVLSHSSERDWSPSSPAAGHNCLIPSAMFRGRERDP